MNVCSRALALCMACALYASPVVAQELSGEERQAKLLDQLKRAEVFYTNGDFLKAASALEDAYRIVPDPRILKRLGEVYERGEEIERALTYYQQYLGTLEDGIERRRMEAIVQDLERRPARLSIETQPDEGVVIEIRDAGSGALVRKVSTPSEPVALPRGEYKLVARKDGYIERESALKLQRGQRAVYAIELVEEAGIPTTTKVLGLTGIAAMAVGVGFTSYGAYKFFSVTAEGPTGSVSRVEYNKSRDAGQRNMVIGGITAGAGLVLGGIGLLYWKLSDDDDAKAAIKAGPGEVGVSVEWRF